MWVDVCNSNRLVQLQCARISRTVTSSFVWSWTISVNEGIQDPESWTQYSSFCISINVYYCLINTSTLDLGVIASVCSLPNSPSWLKFELRPSWKNIHDMFLTGTAQDKTELLGVRCGVKTREACNYDESKGFQHYLRRNHGSKLIRHCRSSVRERVDTAGPAFEREQHRQFRVRETTTPVQRPRESGNRQFRVRERETTTGWGERQQGNQLWYIEPDRVSLTQLSPIHGFSQFRVPKVQWAVRLLEWMGILLV